MKGDYRRRRKTNRFGSNSQKGSFKVTNRSLGSCRSFTIDLSTYDGGNDQNRPTSPSKRNKDGPSQAKKTRTTKQDKNDGGASNIDDVASQITDRSHISNSQLLELITKQ